MTDDAQPSLTDKLFPWLSRPKREPAKKDEPEYTVKYRVDSAGAMHIIIHENGKRLWDEGYLLSSNLTWAKMWTPWFIWKAKRTRKKDERIKRINKDVDINISYHHRDRFDPYASRRDDW